MELTCILCYWSAVRKLNNQIASWDTKFETGTKTILLEPFSPIVIAADENERIRFVGSYLFNFITCTCDLWLDFFLGSP